MSTASVMSSASFDPASVSCVSTGTLKATSNSATSRAISSPVGGVASASAITARTSRTAAFQSSVSGVTVTSVVSAERLMRRCSTEADR